MAATQKISVAMGRHELRLAGTLVDRGGRRRGCVAQALLQARVQPFVGDPGLVVHQFVVAAQ